MEMMHVPFLLWWESHVILPEQGSQIFLPFADCIEKLSFKGDFFRDGEDGFRKYLYVIAVVMAYFGAFVIVIFQQDLADFLLYISQGKDSTA